jgi:hypothetical protein
MKGLRASLCAARVSGTVLVEGHEARLIDEGEILMSLNLTALRILDHEIAVENAVIDHQALDRVEEELADAVVRGTTVLGILVEDRDVIAQRSRETVGLAAFPGRREIEPAKALDLIGSEEVQADVTVLIELGLMPSVAKDPPHFCLRG